eukprot:m.105150 g.105150  ORF g.105150 m.105150 type:complete len:591 (+) comp14193_c0_seq4:1659-3431(+)
MESAEIIRTPRMAVTVVRGRRKMSGTATVLGSHIILSLPRSEIWLLYSKIAQITKRLSTPSQPATLEIVCKDFLALELMFQSDNDASELHEVITHFSVPATMKGLTVFRFPPPLQQGAWQVHASLLEDYQHMGVPDRHWIRSEFNSDYKLCSTYSAILFLPAVLQPSTIFGSSRFRSRGRLPALSFRHTNGAALCRCSQPLSGVQNKRSADDEALVAAIRMATDTPAGTLNIYDVRPRWNAVANKAGGKGYELTENYTNCTLDFGCIENIHVVRDSLHGLVRACRGEAGQASVFARELEGCGWLRHLRTILDASSAIARNLAEGRSVLVHCSDGWDRTAQTCALAQLMLDPYYRTLAGFEKLVEKEWVAFGHKFSDRHAMIQVESKENAPIFLQFLECVHTLAETYPRSFEFNELYLVRLFDALLACQHGTFLGNCERERLENEVYFKTNPVWPDLAHDVELRNPLFNAGAGPATLLERKARPLSVWQAMYCRWDLDVPHQRDDAICSALAELIAMEESRVTGQRVPLTDEATVAAAALPTVLADCCTVCNKTFDMLFSRHRCTRCQRVFCAACFSQEASLCLPCRKASL